MNPAPDSPRALIRYALAGLAITIALVAMLWYARVALVLVYISALFATGLSPLVNALERKRLMRQRVPRWLAILVIYICIITILVGIALIVIPAIVTQTRELMTQLPKLMHQGQQWLIDRGLLTREISPQEAVQQTASRTGAQNTVGLITSAVWRVVGGVFGVITMLVLAFYMIVDADGIVTTFVLMFPRERRPRVDWACRRVTHKVSAWLGGQLLLGGIIGTSTAIGLYLLGVPFVYVLAVICGIGEMVPIIGPVLSAIPAIAVALSVRPSLALFVMIFLFAQQQLENHLLVPKIMQRQVGINPVVVMVALLVGGSVLGVLGALLAVPTAAILLVLFEELSAETTTE